jgi:hypothetical protein
MFRAESMAVGHLTPSLNDVQETDEDHTEPPERTTPSGEVVTAESPSVYQSMYRSIFDRQQKPTIQPSKADGKPVKRARNVFFVVLRYV